jgi:indolepyruvate ferredoxin oxidoreductase beta subunit
MGKPNQGSRLERDRAVKSTNIILTGLGGQGILFMTRILAQSALDNGYNVIGAETHGMAQRGGSVVSHLRLGEVQGSLVQTGTAHILLALDEHEGYRNLPFLSRKGSLFVNTNAHRFPLEDVQAFLDMREIVYRAVPAGVMALELGAPRSSNLALLGFFSAFSEKPFTFAEILQTIERISPDRFKEINRKVFEAGHQRAKKSGGRFCD